MARFIKKLFLFAFYTLVLSICLALPVIIHYDVKTSDIPAPHLSDSYPYNEKIKFLHEHGAEADIITIGSSMSLNNLSSDVITERLGSHSYINTASWGMSMKDDYLLLKILTETRNPHTLVIASNIPDFQTWDKKVKYVILKDYVRGRNSYLSFLKTFNLKYYIHSFIAKKFRSRSNEYEYLGFDQYGGVPYNGDNFHIVAERWNQDFLEQETMPVQYDYLDSMATFCKARNIRFYFFESPLRQGLYSKLSQEKINKLTAHLNKVKSILAKTNHQFVNANDTIWNDSLFVDGIHFHKQGAALFTAYCFNKLTPAVSPATHKGQ
jgi:hypothetical protein